MDLDDVLARQHGVISRQQALACGLTRHALAHRLRSSTGGWRQLLPRTYVSHRGPLADEQRLMASLLYGGPHALLGGVTAARLHGLHAVPRAGAVHLLLPHRTRHSSVGFVQVRRTTAMPDEWGADGWRAVPVARAVIDACREMRRLADVRALVAESVQRRLTDVPPLQAELDRGERAGSRLPRIALEEASAGARSGAEATALRLFRSARLPPASWNPSLYTDSGLFIASPDAYWWEAATAFELDSVAHHWSQADKERTERRHARMTAYGILVVHASPLRLKEDAAGLVDELRRAISIGRLHGPAPGVVARAVS